MVLIAVLGDGEILGRMLIVAQRREHLIAAVVIDIEAICKVFILVLLRSAPTVLVIDV